MYKLCVTRDQDESHESIDPFSHNPIPHKGTYPKKITLPLGSLVLNTVKCCPNFIVGFLVITREDRKTTQFGIQILNKTYNPSGIIIC